MKIATDFKSTKINGKERNYVGLVLVGDHGKEYFMEAFEVLNNKKEEALVLGIQRGLLFTINNKPLFCNNDCDYIIPKNINNVLFQDLLKNSKVVNRFSSLKGQKIEEILEKNEKNEYFLMIANIKINQEVQRDTMIQRNKYFYNSEKFVEK